MKIIASVAFISPMEPLHKKMMKQYHLYVFTQDHCAPCHRLKKHIKTLTDAEKSELDFVPLKTADWRSVRLSLKSLAWSLRQPWLLSRDYLPTIRRKMDLSSAT